MPVSTSRPTPADFVEAYEPAADAGADDVLSLHLSGEVSGTVRVGPARRQAGPDPRTRGRHPTARATRLDTQCSRPPTCWTRADADEEAAGAALARAVATTSLFYVDTLDYLRRGGRIGAAAALLGSALSVKPLLTVDDGRIATLEKVRTAARALARLEELAVEAAGSRSVDVAVAHLAAPDRAAALAERLRSRLGAQLVGREVFVGEVGAVIGAHVGPGMVAVVVAPR